MDLDRLLRTLMELHQFFSWVMINSLVRIAFSLYILLFKVSEANFQEDKFAITLCVTYLLINLAGFHGLIWKNRVLLRLWNVYIGLESAVFILCGLYYEVPN